MPKNYIKQNLTITLIAGIGCLAWMLTIPGDPKNAWLWGFSKSRILMLGAMGCGVLVIGLLWIISLKNEVWYIKLQNLTDRLLKARPILALGWVFSWLGFTITIYFLLYTLTSTDAYLKGFFTRLAPIVLWLTVIFSQATLFLWRGELGDRSVTKKIRSEIVTAPLQYELYNWVVKVLVGTPILLIVINAILWKLPGTRDFALSLMGENQPVEFLTFIFLISGGVLGISLALRARLWSENILIVGFYILFSVGLIFVAMEEIAWGQYIFGFKSPESLRDINVQSELTLHNLGSLQGTSDYLVLLFGFSGLLGLWFGFSNRLKKLAVPIILAPWFLSTVALVVVSSLIGILAGFENADQFMDVLSETNELLVGLAGFFYLFLNSRMLSYGRLRLARIKGIKITQDSLIVELRDSRNISLPLDQIPLLANNTQESREKYQIHKNGINIHWPDLDLTLSADQFLGGGPAIQLYNQDQLKTD